MATAVVAALVIFAGALVFRGVFGVPVLAPEDAGNLGDTSTVVYALMAAVAALLATGLMHVLLLSAPRAMKFFGWILGLVTAIAVVAPFSEPVDAPSQFSTAVINLVAGVAIITLLRSVGRASTLSTRVARGEPTAYTTQEATVRPVGEPAPAPRDETQPVDPREPARSPREEPVLRNEGILPDVKQDEYHKNQIRAQEMDAELERGRHERNDPRAPGDRHAG
jgi:hypothetical protein